MKPRIFLLALSGFMLIGCAENPPDKAESQVEAEIAFDSLKAVDYGADPYGMKKYVMAFLKRGPNRDLDSITKVELQTAHLKNIIRMAEEGQLLVAGPFLDTGEVRGIYIFNTASVEEATALTSTDPAVQAGSLEMELRPWYGSAALMEVTKIHHTISSKSITD